MAGEKTALEMANQARPLELEDAAQQIDMLAALGLPIDGKVAKLRAGKHEGPGRPAGSRNKRTIEMANYLLSRYTSPLEVLAQIAAAPTEQLSAALRCTMLEALQERRLAAIALKDHLHSKMPVAVNVNERKIVHMHMTVTAPPTDQGGVGLAREVIDLSARDITPAADVQESGDGD